MTVPSLIVFVADRFAVYTSHLHIKLIIIITTATAVPVTFVVSTDGNDAVGQLFQRAGRQRVVKPAFGIAVTVIITTPVVVVVIVVVIIIVDIVAVRVLQG